VSEPPLIIPTREGYDRWAEIYDVEQNPLISLEEPQVELLLGEVAGLDIVDVGCGTGRHAVRLAERGANVIGVDFSDGMLARAREKDGASQVRRFAGSSTTSTSCRCRSLTASSTAFSARSSSITSATCRSSSPSWAGSVPQRAASSSRRCTRR
jgi:hypothetical protein